MNKYMNTYKRFKRIISNVMKTRKITKHELSEMVSKRILYKLDNDEPIKLYDAMQLLYTVGLDINGIFTDDYRVETDYEVINSNFQMHIDDYMKSHYKSSDSKEVTKYAECKAITISNLQKGKNVDFITAIRILKKVGLDVLKKLDDVAKIRPALAMIDVDKLCRDLSKRIKSTRLRKGLQMSGLRWRGNISETTARKIEKDCSHTSLQKVIIYLSILGLDPMEWLGKKSTSTNPDLTIIEFYNQLGTSRNSQEISQDFIATELHMNKMAFMCCEEYRAPITMNRVIQWLYLLYETWDPEKMIKCPT